MTQQEYLQNDRVNKEIVKNEGLWKAFFVGGNSTCWAHIHQHYKIYQQRCKDKNIPENHHAIPWPIWKKMQEVKNGNTMTQLKLDEVVVKMQEPKEFTREGILHAISKFVACNDQVSFVKSLKSGSTKVITRH